MKSKMFNYNMLKKRIKEKNMKFSEVAKALKLNAGTFSIKINNGSYFTQDEIYVMLHLLDIPQQDIKQYFFTI